jgi:hypothetical protein
MGRRSQPSRQQQSRWLRPASLSKRLSAEARSQLASRTAMPVNRSGAKTSPLLDSRGARRAVRMLVRETVAEDWEPGSPIVACHSPSLALLRPALQCLRPAMIQASGFLRQRIQFLRSANKGAFTDGATHSRCRCGNLPKFHDVRARCRLRRR